MRKKILAMILAGGRGDELSVLTQMRPKAAVPFGGLYRVIDFPMSNLMHSGIENVGILSQYRSHSLINHIGNGASWEMVGRERSVTILPPFKQHLSSEWYRGSADAVYQNLGFIRVHHPDLVLVLSGDHVYSMNYNPLIDFHLEHHADLTIAFTQTERAQASRFGLGRLDLAAGRRGGRLLEYLEKPETPPDWPEERYWASLTIYLFSTKVLAEVLEQHLSGDPRGFEFGRHIIPEMVKSHRVYGYCNEGYWGYTRTIDEYWQTSMDMLGEHPRIDPEKWQVRTNLAHDAVRDRPPAHLGSTAQIENSLIYSGCRIHGTVKNSILFPGVEIGENVLVEDSILMFDTRVAAGCRLHKVIADSEACLAAECEIGHGDPTLANEEYPRLLRSGITLIGRGAHVPERCRIGSNCIVHPGLTPARFRQRRYESGVSIS
ncbi:MAG: glucose-1-phosphate adenylyltransferase [candidate division KSB1 bacterium]|nr:glucose-1-phosphate adenylyltransferase [candidate division KSB1 bacterium]MDZ7288139.1 glucose-1-phosphate adenylyltransferase [candidate division KSB1 bacterium]MDZ7300348.1 glucose-1-phosphate adenylyltransferase [candidate division KSB1 bacterium]MDZ7351348.1 glucose-1-phosphate adenylyltransferase [candidate division KSB1 bacterium]MDZ7355652.1 glucose-1-phosphate adenylyltransferase [candidate division KSB1 bacterium]